METIIGRLDKYLRIKGISGNSMEVTCGLPKGTLSKARSGKTDIGKVNVARILNKFHDLNRVWLLTGDGSMLNELPSISLNNVHGPNTANVNSHNMNTVDSNQVEMAGLQSKIKELEMEVAHLQDKLRRSDEWASKLFEILKKGQK